MLLAEDGGRVFLETLTITDLIAWCQSKQLYVIRADHRFVKSGLKYNTSERNRRNRASLLGLLFYFLFFFYRNDSNVAGGSPGPRRSTCMRVLSAGA